MTWWLVPNNVDNCLNYYFILQIIEDCKLFFLLFGWKRNSLKCAHEWITFFLRMKKEKHSRDVWAHFVSISYTNEINIMAVCRHVRICFGSFNFGLWFKNVLNAFFQRVGFVWKWWLFYCAWAFCRIFQYFLNKSIKLKRWDSWANK